VTTIAVLDHGSGNLHSVSRAIARVGGSVTITSDPQEVARADALVIPGVGHFGACMRSITGHGMDVVIRDYVGSRRPVFGVCVGMQVLFEGSEESDEAGLAILPGHVRRLPDDVKVPHMGWNTVHWSEPHAFLRGIDDGTRFYFVHSYAPDATDPAPLGTTDYGRPFAAAVASDMVFATQFHPEKSGEAGLQVYENFVRAVA
jgi:glutamine amidotransferase